MPHLDQNQELLKGDHINMTLEDVKKSRELAGNNVIKIINDNQHIFYYNREEAPELIFDDANERRICFRPNQDPWTQDILPVEVVVFSYDQIQHMMIVMKVNDALDILNSEGVSMDATKKKYTEEFLKSLDKNQVAKINSYTDTKKDKINKVVI